jgi:serine/threonine protein kinase
MISNEPHGQAVDMWALGVLCYELLVGMPPFGDTEEYTQAYMRIRTLDVHYPEHVSPLAKDFMSRVRKLPLLFVYYLLLLSLVITKGTKANRGKGR